MDDKTKQELENDLLAYRLNRALLDGAIQYIKMKLAPEPKKEDKDDISTPIKD